MSSSLNMVKTGKVTKAAAATKKVVLGFKPRYVKVFNETTLAEAWAVDTMDAGKSVKRVAAGTATLDADSLTLNSDGFTIGNDAQVGGDGVVQYVAYEGKND